MLGQQTLKAWAEWALYLERRRLELMALGMSEADAKATITNAIDAARTRPNSDPRTAIDEAVTRAKFAL
jgi:hypothetical protein